MARDVNRFETTADQQRGAEKSTPGRSTSRTSAATCAQHNDRRLPAWKIPQIVKTEPRRHSRKLPNTLRITRMNTANTRPATAGSQKRTAG
jgi:hypothetical protein